MKVIPCNTIFVHAHLTCEIVVHKSDPNRLCQLSAEAILWASDDNHKPTVHINGPQHIMHSTSRSCNKQENELKLQELTCFESNETIHKRPPVVWNLGIGFDCSIHITLHIILNLTHFADCGGLATTVACQKWHELSTWRLRSDLQYVCVAFYDSREAGQQCNNMSKPHGSQLLILCFRDYSQHHFRTALVNPMTDPPQSQVSWWPAGAYHSVQAHHEQSVQSACLGWTELDH